MQDNWISKFDFLLSITRHKLFLLGQNDVEDSVLCDCDLCKTKEQQQGRRKKCLCCAVYLLLHLHLAFVFLSFVVGRFLLLPQVEKEGNNAFWGICNALNEVEIVREYKD